MTLRSDLALRVVAVAAVLAAAPVAAEPLATDWQAKPKARLRLIAGHGEGSPGTLLAGVEVVLEPGWKTYWRVPGDSGVPPSFDLSASGNLEKAEVLYPAPRRYTDSSGDVIGYKGSVVFPIALKPKDPTRPIELALSLEIGVCERICIPVDARLGLNVPPAAGAARADAALTAALATVPRPEGERRPDDPRIVGNSANLKAAKPELVLDLAFPGGASGADLFIEGSEGSYVPLPRQAGQGPQGTLRFTVDLSSGVDIKDIDGKPLRLTIVSDKAAVETTWIPN